ncbi:MAG: SRPBCC domain-containing protein [Geothrix sp.]|uniref:SRPBCC domain-containing protein n=1 Tax=Geothrix sp. TaxID=1962974 RepID=UPI003BAEF6BA
MKRLQFSTLIQAPREQVWETMLGPVTYRIWSAAFMEGSYYEGTWAKGQRLRFLAPGGSGMVSEIAELRPHEFLSIRHLGEIKDGVEDTQSEAVRSWTPCFENYTFGQVGVATELTVDMDMTEAFEEYMTKTWPKALSLLKALSEARAASPRP